MTRLARRSRSGQEANGGSTRLSRLLSRRAAAALLAVLVAAASGERLRAQEDLQQDMQDNGPPQVNGPAFLPWLDDTDTSGPTDAGPSGAHPDAAAPVFDPARLALLPELRVGVVMDPAAGDFGRVGPLREALETGLRIPVLLIAYRDLAHLQRAILAAEIDYAPLSASAYAEADRDCRCLEPLVAPRLPDGEVRWHAIVLARAGEGVASLAEIAGRRIATGPRAALGSRLAQIAAAAAIGVDLGRKEAALIEHPDPVAAALALIRGDADVAFAWSSLKGEPAEGYSSGTLRDLRRRAVETDGLEVVWASEPIAGAPHVVRRDLPQEIRRAIVAVMTGKEVAAAVSSGGFVPVEARDYAPVAAAFPPDAGAASRGRMTPLGGRD